MWKVITPIILFALANTTYAAIAFDTATDVASSGSTITISSFDVTGENLIGIVGLETYAGVGAGKTVTAITWNGVAMTEAINHMQSAAGADTYFYLYYIYGPTDGDIVITLSGSATYWASAATYTGVIQSGIPEDTNYAHGTSITINPTTANSWVTGYIGGNDGNSFTAGANTTARNPTGDHKWIGDSNTTVTSTWTLNTETNSATPLWVAMSLAPYQETPAPTSTASSTMTQTDAVNYADFFIDLFAILILGATLIFKTA